MLSTSNYSKLSTILTIGTQEENFYTMKCEILKCEYVGSYSSKYVNSNSLFSSALLDDMYDMNSSVRCGLIDESHIFT